MLFPHSVRRPWLCALALFCAGTPLAQATNPAPDYAALVDPRLGTAGDGQTYPIAGVPFAMTDWTPETQPGQQKCVPPYLYRDHQLTGFRASHFPSGSCTQDYGSLTLMPYSGAAASRPKAAFAHAEEESHPYFYGVDLDRGNATKHIRAELTGTLHCGILRFRFPATASAAHIALHLNGASHDNQLTVDAKHHEVTGSSLVRRLYAGQGRPAGFRSYFVAQFDQPFQPDNTPSTSSATLQFHTAGWVQVRIGISFVSLDAARRNLQAEIPTWNFAHCESAAHSAWQQQLGRIAIAGSAPQRRIFYTALYHSLLLPRTVSDVDGSYPAFNGDAHTEKAVGFTYYDDFSLWDTFRAVHPLLTLLDPQRETDMVRSLLAKGQQGGYLPIFPAWNSYTAEMLGDHADAVILDAWAKGLRDFPAEQAYALMRHNAMVPATPSQADNGEGRSALSSYLKLGFIPLEDHVPEAFHHNEQVSRTLEYAYDDWAVGQLAAALGKTDDAALFHRRAANWHNVFDASIGFARGRHADGSWQTPFDPARPDPAVTESVPWEYTFFVPQDIAGLRTALGGPQAMAARLDGLFARHLYQQGNEPSHSIAYLYNDAGQPYKTQAQVRRILDTLYTDQPAGLPGNDDAGQMSAWYVFSALGFYPVTPGLPQYAFGSPRFDRTVLHLPNGHALSILADGAEQGLRYVRQITLNGVPLHRTWVEHSELLSGGTLVFTMAAAPVYLSAPAPSIPSPQSSPNPSP